MKLFTNKFLIGTCLCLLFCACSSKEEQPAVEVVEDIQTQAEPVALPPLTKEVDTQAQPTKEVTTPKKYYPNEVIIRLKAWDQKLKYLQTHFEQTTQYDGVEISRSQGNLFYDKDKNLLRLDTLSVDGNSTEQSAVTDKQKILILDGQGREITTLDWTEWQQGQPNQALFDFGNYTALLARHNISLKEPNLLELTPKEGEPYTLYLTLDPKDELPTNIKIVADLMVTEAKLSNTQKNQPLPFDTFRAGGLFK